MPLTRLAEDTHKIVLWYWRNYVITWNRERDLEFTSCIDFLDFFLSQLKRKCFSSSLRWGIMNYVISWNRLKDIKCILLTLIFINFSSQLKRRLSSPPPRCGQHGPSWTAPTPQTPPRRHPTPPWRAPPSTPARSLRWRSRPRPNARRVWRRRRPGDAVRACRPCPSPSSYARSAITVLSGSSGPSCSSGSGYTSGSCSYSQYSSHSSSWKK